MRFPTAARFSLLALCLAVAAMACAREEEIELKAEDQMLIGPMNVASLNRLGLAALGGTPSSVGTFLPAFDRRLDTAYTAKEAGTAILDVTFHRPQTLHFVRVMLDEGRYEWSVASAETPEDLDRGAGTFRYVVTAQQTQSVGGWMEGKLISPTAVKALRLTVRPLSAQGKVTVKEINLVAEQKLETLSLKAPSHSIPIGEQVPLEVTAYFSGGETRTAKGKSLKWTVRPDVAARMTTSARIVGRRKGPIEIGVAFGKLASPPLQLQVVEGD